MTGISTGGKPINLAQLEAEMVTAGATSDGLGMGDQLIYVYDDEGLPTDFSSADQPIAEQAVASHVAMRNKTDAEYAAEFQDAATTPERKQEIRDIQNGLLPPEQVPA